MNDTTMDELKEIVAEMEKERPNSAPLVAGVSESPPHEARCAESQGSGLYTIARGIPIPEKRRRPAKYPFAHMAAGDSFFVPIKEASPGTVQQSARKYAKRHMGFQFVARTLKREGGTRIWCVASPNKQDLPRA
jgi:hypothetical protein